MELDDSVFKQAVSRRSVLKVGAAGLLASQMALLEKLAWMPDRLALAAPALPDIQHDVGNFIAPAFSEDGVMVRFGPVFTALVPAKLTRTPTQADQRHLAQALDTMEQVLGFSPAGVIPFIGYGLPYFARLPQPIVNAAIPRLAGFGHKFGSGSVLKEARPSTSRSGSSRTTCSSRSAATRFRTSPRSWPGCRAATSSAAAGWRRPGWPT